MLGIFRWVNPYANRWGAVATVHGCSTCRKLGIYVWDRSDVCASARNEGIVHLKKIFDPLEVAAMQENRKGLEHCDKLSEERRPSISL